MSEYSQLTDRSLNLSHFTRMDTSLSYNKYEQKIIPLLDTPFNRNQLKNQHNMNKIIQMSNQTQRMSDPTKNEAYRDRFRLRLAIHGFLFDHIILREQLRQFGMIKQVQQYFYIYMNSCFNEEINLLCIGDILSGKSTFLESYTQSTPENLHYRIYSKINVDQTVVYFHEVKERFGMQAYFSYPFDAILYFLNIDDYHNPQFAIIQQLAQVSKINGTNIFKMPLKVIVLSSKNNQWSRIEKFRKMHLIHELEGMVTQSMIIFVENNQVFLEELQTFFKNVENQQAEGIQESLYVDWQLKGMQGLLPFQNLIFNLKKMSQQLKKQWSKLHFPNMLKKKSI